MNYLWIKAFHIIFMVAWFAGLFYIFRLFVYHVKHKDRPEVVQVLNVMESKLLRIIMAPALFFTILLGSFLIVLNPAVLYAGWFHAKLTGVFFLILYHILAVMTHRQFARGNYWLSEKACRMINEIPTLCLFLVVILVVVKP